MPGPERWATAARSPLPGPVELRVGEAEVGHACGGGQEGDGVLDLGAPTCRQGGPGRSTGDGVRPLAVGGDEDVERGPGVGEVGEQAADAERLVIGVGGDDEHLGEAADHGGEVEDPHGVPPVRAQPGGLARPGVGVVERRGVRRHVAVPPSAGAAAGGVWSGGATRAPSAARSRSAWCWRR